ncbi:hypothetical protein CKJ89_39880, partial [Klebsiella pneumoniae]
RSRGNYFVDFAPLRAVNFSVYSLLSGITPRLIFSKKTPDKSGDCAIIISTFGSQPLFKGPTSCFSTT